MSNARPAHVDLASSAATPVASHGLRAFTLAELVLSMAIMSILMTGLASAILIASHALPNTESPSQTTVANGEVVHLLAEELRSALWIRERTATSVEFAVPDRNDDGDAERIRYAWSGIAGQPLTRQYNGKTVVNMTDSVHEFDLTYDLKAVTEEYSGAATESAEALLSSYATVINDVSIKLQPEYWIGQYFEASALPVDAIGWTVTRVLFQAKVNTSSGATVSVQLQTANPDRTPTGTVLGEATVFASELSSSWQWVESSYADVFGITPGAGLCLVLDNSVAGFASSSPFKINQETQGGSGCLSTGDAGASWTYEDDKSMYYYVYGTYMMPGPPQTATRQYVMSVGISLQSDDDPTSRVVTAVQTLNTPELLSGWWQADFESDPTLDHNGDGKDDWTVREGGEFDTGSLAAGVWSADATLGTYPDSDFSKLTTAELRFRNTSIGGDGAVFWINADWSGSSCAPIVVTLQLQADATQMLTVYRKTDEATRVGLLKASGLSTDFVTLRLLIDPDLNTVGVWVNGVDCGAFAYSTITPSSADHFASVFASGSDAEFDYVSVRVGE